MYIHIWSFNCLLLRTLGFIIILSFTIGCSKRIDLVIDQEEKLLIECVMTPGQEIQATLSTVANFSDSKKIEYPENARIYLITKIDTPLEFEYDSDRKLYFIPKKVHTMRLDYHYEIRAYLVNDEDNELSATLKFPSINSVDKTESAMTVLNQTNGQMISGNFAFKNNTIRSPFFNMNAYCRMIDEEGRYSELLPIEFIENKEDALAFYQNEFTNGVYVDINRVDPTDFSMSYLVPSEYFENGRKLADHIHIYSSAISEEVYRYELSKSKQLAAIHNGASDPVINYTNVKNGFGVFGASLVKRDSINIR